MIPVHSFHVLARPLGERSLLYLASPQLDEPELAFFLRERVGIFVASSEFSKEAWEVVEKRLDQKIVFESDLSLLNTSRPLPSKEALPEVESRT